MSKMKNYDRALYPSIGRALHELREHHRYTDSTVFSPLALEDCLGFLCVNNIPHSYSRSNAGGIFGATDVVSLTWTEEDGEYYISWYEKDNRISSAFLLQFCDNYCDEFDVEGFVVIDGIQFSEWLGVMQKLSEYMKGGKSFEYYFGTNEWIEYEDYNEFFNCFTCTPISVEEGKFLKDKFIGEYSSFGIIPFIETIQDWIEDQERFENE